MKTRKYDEEFVRGFSERLLSRTQRAKPDDTSIPEEDRCLLWLGGITHSFQPVHYSKGGGVFPVARILWQSEYGDIPEGYRIYSTCISRNEMGAITVPCVNPRHLFASNASPVHVKNICNSGIIYAAKGGILVLPFFEKEPPSESKDYYVSYKSNSNRKLYAPHHPKYPSLKPQEKALCKKIHPEWFYNKWYFDNHTKLEDPWGDE